MFYAGIAKRCLSKACFLQMDLFVRSLSPLSTLKPFVDL